MRSIIIITSLDHIEETHTSHKIGAVLLLAEINALSHVKGPGIRTSKSLQFKQTMWVFGKNPGPTVDQVKQQSTRTLALPKKYWTNTS